MKLVALPALSDNYIWMLHDGFQALVVDPGQVTPVSEALDALNLRLTGILVTHHHHDHVDGLAGLLPRLQGTVWGTSDVLPIPVEHPTAPFEWAGLRIEPMPVPGHTLRHMAYFLPEVPNHAPVLFCGDTLFSASCGRLFEGTPAQMQASLDSLAALPSATLVCCTHEYTLDNLRFAQAVEPANEAIRQHQQVCENLREQGLPTLPSHLARERQINPFLRCEQPAVVAAAQAQGAGFADRLSVFTALRLWKNRYR